MLPGHLVIKLQMIPSEFNLLISYRSIKLLQSVSGGNVFSLRIKSWTVTSGMVVYWSYSLPCRGPLVSEDLVEPAAPREPMVTLGVPESPVFLVPEWVHHSFSNHNNPFLGFNPVTSLLSHILDCEGLERLQPPQPIPYLHTARPDQAKTMCEEAEGNSFIVARFRNCWISL